MEETFDRNQLVRIARHATKDVFGTMLGMEIEPLEAYAESEPPVAAAGILSLIGFAGTWVGNGSFFCTAAMACSIADALLMAEHHTVDEEVLDAMAEMTNMILGNVKTELEAVLGPMLLSIPTVLYGRNFVKRSMGKREWIVIPFNCKEERFEIQICMAPNPNPEALRNCLRPYGVHA
jgi:chemotaxis protein CheX